MNLADIDREIRGDTSDWQPRPIQCMECESQDTRWQPHDSSCEQCALGAHSIRGYCTACLRTLIAPAERYA